MVTIHIFQMTHKLNDSPKLTLVISDVVKI